MNVQGAFKQTIKANGTHTLLYILPVSQFVFIYKQSFALKVNGCAKLLYYYIEICHVIHLKNANYSDRRLFCGKLIASGRGLLIRLC